MNFTPLADQILVLPDPPADKVGSIVIPDRAKSAAYEPGPSNDTGIGTVVAVGPGDRHKPFESIPCRWCRQKPEYFAPIDGYVCGCQQKITTSQVAAEWNAGRHVMDTQVGDRVIFPRRANMRGGEFKLTLDGVEYVMFNEEQSCLAIINR